MIEQIANQIRVLRSNGNVKRSHAFISFRVHGVTGHCTCDASGVVGGSVHLGIHVGPMLDHEIEKLRANRAATAGAAAEFPIGRTRNAGGIQEWRESHTIDVRIGALLDQQSRDIKVATDEGAQQRGRSRTEQRVAESSSLVAGTTHVELRIRIDTGRQQQVDDLHA